MNPNNKEGRYHWICERLEFISDGRGDRKLNLGKLFLFFKVLLLCVYFEK